MAILSLRHWVGPARQPRVWTVGFSAGWGVDAGLSAGWGVDLGLRRAGVWTWGSVRAGVESEGQSHRDSLGLGWPSCGPAFPSPHPASSRSRQGGGLTSRPA